MLGDLSVMNTKGYFRYNGSLTTPKCKEIVTWSIFKKRIKISSKQVIKNN